MGLQHSRPRARGNPPRAQTRSIWPHGQISLDGRGAFSYSARSTAEGLPQSLRPQRRAVMPTMRNARLTLAALSGLLAAPLSAHAAGKHYALTATQETVEWGWLDPRSKPRLTIDSGDTVSIETLMHAKDQLQPGVTIEKIVELRKANPGGGPHSLTGPIFVKGAMPGDVLEIRILKIVPKKAGTNFNLPGKEFPTIGALAKDFPEGHVNYFKIDPKAKTIEFKPGINIPLRPFPGPLAAGINPDDPSPPTGCAKDPLSPVSTIRPWKNGSNMDINEKTAGSPIFIPGFLHGRLLWTAH